MQGLRVTSLLEPNIATFEALGQFKKSAVIVARQAVETKALDSIDEIPEFDLLKIDIQGGEVAVFEAGARKIGKAVAVITEVAGTPI